MSMSLPNTSSQAPATQSAETDPKNTTTDSQGSQNRTNTPGGRRKRRSTEVSISGLDSGTESDFPKPKISRQEGAAEKVKKSKRKRQKRKTPLTAFSLTKFLNKLQVFP